MTEPASIKDWKVEYAIDVSHTVQPTGETMLHLACRADKPEAEVRVVVQLLLEKGTSPLVEDGQGRVPADISRERGHVLLGLDLHVVEGDEILKKIVGKEREEETAQQVVALAKEKEKIYEARYLELKAGKRVECEPGTGMMQAAIDMAIEKSQ